ncbi:MULTISPECIES: DUF1508 domain-containing protein [Micrococcaceae]|uniref:YegP family protein n=1 Tax=Micrococcaceae TaxID=1268 RepID=UPI001BA8A0F9|nr:DUF1508 domain-containing protein [Pseudarthrobacter albicanus]
MTGTFELFVDEDFGYRFTLKAPDGTVMALSRSFPDKQAAVSGISGVREYAGMGLITDLSETVHPAAGIPARSSRHRTNRPAFPGQPFHRQAAISGRAEPEQGCLIARTGPADT